MCLLAYLHTFFVDQHCIVATKIKHKALLQFKIYMAVYIFDSGFMASSLLMTATRLGPSFLKSTNTQSS